MAYKRELILVRLLAVLGETVGQSLRNPPTQSETRRPIALLYDGDEEADDNDPASRPPTAPRRVSLLPEIFVLMGAKSDDIGTVMNTMLASVIKAVLYDPQLTALVGRNGSILYQGAMTTLAQGRQRDANMSIGFSFQYVLIPADL